jgi:hypothetical protein
LAQNNTAGLFGADSFGSPAPYGAANNTSFSTASTFTGTVILRQRATANPGWTGTINLAGGRVEIQDVGALPATNTNTPAVTLSGGELAVNVSGNPLAYTYRLSGQNIAPGSGNMAALLNVSASSKLSNSAVDFYGRAREQNSLWNGSITIASGTVLTFNTGGGTSIGGNVSGAVWGGTGTLRLGTAAANNSGANRLRLAGNLATGANSITFDLGTSGTLDTNVATGGTGNLGSLVSGTGTFLIGQQQRGRQHGRSERDSRDQLVNVVHRFDRR